MAVPKKKVSKSRGRMRRAHQALPTKQLYTCPNCGQKAMPHTVCTFCGFYRTKVVMNVHEDEA